MIEDLASNQHPPAIETGICVIGAGAAGLAISLTLARLGVDVVMLESGGEQHDAAIHDLNRCDIAGRPFIGALEGRFRALGGSTTRWGGQILPLQPIDLEARAWVNASGWPIAYSDLVPGYKSALQLVGLGNCIESDCDVWRSVRTTAPRFGAECLQPHFSRWCPEPNLAIHLRPEIERLANLRCILRATVTALRAEGGRVSLAHARSLTGQRLDIRARRFVVCVGGIETPRLLLHPLDGGAHPPWTGYDLIGRYLQDHPGLTSANIVPRRRADLHRQFDNVVHGRTRYQPKLRLSDAELRRRKLLQASCSIIFRSQRGDTLVAARAAGKNLLVGRAGRDEMLSLIGAAPMVARMAWRTFVRHRAFNLDDQGFRLGMQLEQQPDPDSRVTLAGEVDALGLRRARIDWRIGPSEIETAAAATGLFKHCFEAAGLGRVDVDADVAARSPDLASRMHDQNHHNGTARMATSPRDGVVDRDLRVFGAENLFVCGSAVFPTGGSSNPTHTILALGIRLAEHLRSTSGNA